MRNPSPRNASANLTILPTKVDLSPSQIDGVLITPEDGAGAGAGVGGTASTREAQADKPEREGLREDVSLSFSVGGGALDEGAARDGGPQCWTDEEGKGRCLPTVFFLGVSKCGEPQDIEWGGVGRFPVLISSPVWLVGGSCLYQGRMCSCCGH